MESLNVAYILLRFPYLTETFIAEEVHALRAKGVDVKIISLLEPGKGATQPLSKKLLPFTQYVPSLISFSLWKAQVFFLITSSKLYAKLLFTLLSRPYSSRAVVLFFKRLTIFMKATTAAYNLRNQKPHMLHAHFAWLPGAAAWVMARLLGVPFSVTIHAYDLFAYTDLFELVMREADHVVAISEYNRQFVHNLGYRSKESISVIHCGINVAQFRNDHTVTKADNRLKIISVGSLYPKKGHQFLVEACRLLMERDVLFECNIVGTGYEEEMLQSLIAQYGLESHVKLVGTLSTPEVSKVLQAHDVFVLAATIAPNGDRDGIPVVMMEAGATGLPLISSVVSGIPEIVLDNQTGFTVPAEDPVALANAIEKLAVNPQLREGFGRNAQDLVNTEFNIDVNSSSLRQMFAQLV